MDRLQALEVFVAVAERGSFAAAARRLGVSAAATTRAVAQVEAQLGLVLLHRTTRAVRLTERGALYLDRCRQILAEIADADRAVRGEDAAPRGTLTVAAPLMFGRLHVLPVVQRLLRAWPALSVRLLLSDRLVHLAEEGIDVAVRIGPPADSALVALRVRDVRRVLVASPAYLDARGTPATPAALAAHDLIDFAGSDGPDEWQFSGDVSFRVRAARLSVTSGDAAIAAAEAGLGITRVISYQVKAQLASAALRLVLEDVAPPPLPVHVMYPARRFAAPNVTAFVAEARAYFEEND